MGHSDVCHVRPHGSDSSDVYELPCPDKILGVKKYSKQCFWLNSSYIGEIYKTLRDDTFI